MKLYSRYVGYVYFKYVVILFIALECFYVGIDVLTNLKDFPQSANTALLYIALTASVAVTYTLPLSLIFALIITAFNMIRSNEFDSFYALGVSKNSFIVPPFLIALIITLIYIGLNNTPFAYSLRFQKNLTNFSQIWSLSNDMFLKFEGKYIYIKELNPGAKAASDIAFFEVKDNALISKSSSQKGVYEDKKWHFSELNTTILPSEFELGKDGLKYEIQNDITALGGFDPNTIESVYDSANVYTISEAIKSIKTFKSQGINVGSIKANLYNMIFFPLFAPLMVLILYYYLPVTGRFFNLALLSFGFFIATLCIWGVLFVLIRFSLNGVIIPELGIIMPIFAMFLFALYLVFKHR